MTEKAKQVVFSNLVEEQKRGFDKKELEQKRQAEMVSYCEGLKNLYE